MTHAERATQYARDVVEGRVLACRYVKLACQRHLDDLERSESEDYPYRFDEGVANKWCRFVEQMPHVKGRWAREREMIVLEDWQCFTVGVPLGWVRKKDGLRRFRRVYDEEPRKQAKSTKIAAVGLGMMTIDNEEGAEVYCGATTEQQAWEVFRPAKQMAERTDKFREYFGVQVNAKTIIVPKTSSRFAPLIGKPGDGASPSFSITDEYHEHATEEQYDTMMTGMGAREQPMSWVITTAGADTSGPCYALRNEAIEVLEGKVDNPEFFAIIFTIDEDDDWTTEEALIKANPNIDVSVSKEFLLSQQRDAINNPRKQSAFKTKHLNVWVGAASPFFNAEKWDRLGNTSLKSDDCVGLPCYVAVDLAAKIDIAGFGLLFFDEDADRYLWFPRFYVPAAVASDAAKRKYDAWVTQGHLTATPGNVTDFDVIEADIVAEIERHNVVHAAFDQWNSMQLSTRISNQTGVECIDIPMSVKHLSDPMKWVQALIEDSRLRHDGNPIMSWMVGNVTAQEDRNGNVFPRKERPENKIDGAVMLIMAMERGFQQPGDESYLSGGELAWVD